MTNSIAKTLMLFAGLLMVAEPAFAREGRREGRGQGKGQVQREGRGRGEGRWLKKLNLTEEQRKQVEALKKGNRSEMKAKRETIRAAQDSLQKALQGSAEEADLVGQFESLEKLRSEVARSRFEHMLKIRKILTPEQRKKMRGMREHKKWRKHRRKGRREQSDRGDSDSF